MRDPRDCILNNHATDDLNVFGIEYNKTQEIRENRAYSWKYQRELMKATPDPKNLLKLRFEDMVFSQDETLQKLEEYLGIKMAKIEMRADSVGRWKTDGGRYMYDFFAEDMIECGYEI